jgi:outer membrane protein assembly factor BamB
LSRALAAFLPCCAIRDLWTNIRDRGKALWNDHRWATIGVAAGLGAAVIALVAYLALKRPGDKSCKAPCTITATTPKPVSGLTDWPVYGLNAQRTRYLDAPAVKQPFSIRWRFKGRNLLEYSPVLVGNQLFGVNNNGMAFAVKATTGKARWKQQIAHLNASSPSYSDRILYVANLEPGQVVALATWNGQVLWKHPLPGRSESSPLVVGNRVIVGCECNTVYALDRATGKTIWERHLNGAVKAAPAYENGIVYIGDYSGEMNAIRASDGSIKWQTGSQGSGFGRSGRFYAAATVAFGRVYAGNVDGRMYSFDQRTGDLVWSQSTGNYVYAAAIAARTPDTQPTVYFGSYDGTFYALDARTGDERWSVPDLGAISGAASLIGDTAYVADLKTTSTYGFDVRNGHKVFQYQDGAYNPVISNGKELFLTGYKTLYAMRPSSGPAKDGILQKEPKAPAAAGQSKAKPAKRP